MNKKSDMMKPFPISSSDLTVYFNLLSASLRLGVGVPNIAIYVYDSAQHNLNHVALVNAAMRDRMQRR